eukprot:7039200-Pyramimonas_sp.AAC.1
MAMAMAMASRQSERVAASLRFKTNEARACGAEAPNGVTNSQANERAKSQANELTTSGGAQARSTRAQGSSAGGLEGI